MARETATVTSKGQVTIPVEVRRRLGLEVGSRLEFVTVAEGVLVRPVREGNSPFAGFRGYLPELGDGEAVDAWLGELRGHDR